MPARTRRGSGPGAGPSGSGSGGSGRARRAPEQPSPTTRATTRVEAPGLAAEPRRSGTFTSRALILLLVVAVLGVSYASSVRAWLNQRDEQRSLSSQIAGQQATIAQLQADKARWNDPAYIEDQARLRFGWVLPGERSYRVIGKDGKVLSAGQGELATPLTGSTAPQPAWWVDTLNSVTQADAATPAKAPAKPARHPATILRPSSGNPTGR